VSQQVQSSRRSAGFLSSSRFFFLPVGRAIDPSGVRGYPIDMRVKAHSDALPLASHAALDRIRVATMQYALGCHERWLDGEGEQWLAAATDVGRYLVSAQEEDGSWLHRTALRHTFPMPAPWRSAMAQGQGASLLVRLYLQTGDEDFATSALAALAPMSKSPAEGGVRAELDGRPWLEEYPTEPPSYVLNGAIFALWGLRDVSVGLDDNQAGKDYATGVQALRENLWRFDTGWWSLYSLYPHRVRNVASSFYHDLHVNQLRAMDQLHPQPEFRAVATRWEGYSNSAVNRRHAFARKAAFRLLVPRNRLLAGRAVRSGAARSRALAA
jgi:heparosan-N-sulfate-glucuronate 5-epimerase